MTHEESIAEAERILTEAGWRTMPDRAGFCFQVGPYRHVGGIQPDGLGAHAKNIDAIKEGHPLYSPDTPDEYHEAAAWLVARFAVAPAPGTGVLGSDAVAVEASSELDDEPVGGASDYEYAPNDAAGGEAIDAPSADLDFWSGEGADLGAELAEEPPDEYGPGRFVFGDNLDQRRTAAIGLVVQNALERMPAPIDYARLSELRNFVMGVSEARWGDDAAKRAELDALEALERRRRLIEAVRDEKVAPLVKATHAELDVFDPEAGWPE